MAPPLIRSWHGRGPTSEGIELAEEPKSEAPSMSLMASGKGVETQSSSPSIMMSMLKIPESSPTAGPIGGKTPIVEAPLVEVLSLLPKEDDHDIGSEPAPHDISKFSHETEEEMQAAAPRDRATV